MKSPEHIRIVNFNRQHLLKPVKKALEICSSAHLCPPAVDLSCYRNKPFQQDDLLSVRDHYQEIDQENEEAFQFPSDMVYGPVQACFENDEVATPLELLEVFDRLTRHESTLSSPPEEFLTSCRDYLLSLKPSVVVSTFQEEEINAIDFLLNDDCWMTKVPPFVKLIWFHAFQMIENHIIENQDDVVNIGQQDFSEATFMLNQFFNGDDFSLFVRVVFGTNKGTLPQRTIARTLATFIYFGFLERLKSTVRQDEICEAVSFDVQETSEVGLSKVRHVGGWAVRKVLSRAHQYVQKNVHTKFQLNLGHC